MDENDVIIARLTEQNASPLRQLAELTATVRQLRDEIARLKKDSSNSSKPPSSDIVKPPPPNPRRKGKRKRGGQVGHHKHVRPVFPPEQVDKAVEHELKDAAGLRPLNDWRVVQQIELLARPFVIVEHRARRYRCMRTGRIITAPLPGDVARAGPLGPRLSALVACQKGACHMSYATIAMFLRDVLGVSLSKGHLAKVVRKAGAALAGAYEQLAAALPDQPRLGVDETGHKDNGSARWPNDSGGTGPATSRS